MPWKVFNDGEQWCIHKLDGTGEPESEAIEGGCHPSEAEAERHLKALYANVEDAEKRQRQAVKAAGEWVLDVLGVPYGGPIQGKDAQGEYFSAQTRTHEDKWASPPVVYYHGFGTDGRPAGSPEYIGRTLKRWSDAAGHWFRVELDRASQFAQRVWQAAQQGTARASSGSVAHLVRKASDGHILEWPVAELSVFDTGEGREPANGYAVALPVMKAIYDRAGLSMPDLAPVAGTEADDSASTAGSNRTAERKTVEVDMAEQDIQKVVAEAVAEALKAQRAADEAEARRINEERARVEAAVTAAKAQWEAEAAKAGRLPYVGTPTVTRFNDRKYDHMSFEDMALAHQILATASKRGQTDWNPAEERFLKSMAGKMRSVDGKGTEAAEYAIKMLGPTFKSNEIMQSTLASYGDEWIGVAYSTALWEKIRLSRTIVAKIPQVEIPQGFESETFPLESTDPTFYKVAQAADLPTTEATGWPNATISSSRVTTGNKSVTVAKMGARVLHAGELSEDSLIPAMPQIRTQLEKAGAEQLEYAVIDGDTATTASTNVNDIAGTPTSTDLFLMTVGFRGLALRVNSANSRSCGALTTADFLETLKLMGTGGVNVLVDPLATEFILDPWTYWKALEMDEVKTRDVFSTPVIENGALAALWGRRINVSDRMHYAGVVLGTVTTAAYQLKANSAGKVDQDTEANNLYGAILAVRFNQWKLAWKRRMTMETTRIARADTWEIVALCRWGLGYRDTEASAITYGVNV